MKLINFIFFTLFFTPPALAIPTRIDVIFMSRIDAIPVKPNLAQWSLSIELIRNLQAAEIEDANNETGSLQPLDPLNSNIVHCDEKSAHSFFCPPKKTTTYSKSIRHKIEIYTDISSSFLLIDPPERGSCARKEFLTSLLNQCAKGEMGVELYNTQKSKMKSLNDSCGVVGLNNKKRVLQWVKSSQSDQLIIITDVYEMERDFFEKLKEMGAKFYGDKRDAPIDRKNLKELLSQIKITCNKG